MQAIERCDVAVLVVDAVSGITAQDTHIAGYIKDAWKSVMVVINKWDLIEKTISQHWSSRNTSGRS